MHPRFCGDFRANPRLLAPLNPWSQPHQLRPVTSCSAVSSHHIRHVEALVGTPDAALAHSAACEGRTPSRAASRASISHLRGTADTTAGTCPLTMLLGGGAGGTHTPLSTPTGAAAAGGNGGRVSFLEGHQGGGLPPPTKENIAPDLALSGISGDFRDENGENGQEGGLSDSSSEEEEYGMAHGPKVTLTLSPRTLTPNPNRPGVPRHPKIQFFFSQPSCPKIIKQKLTWC